MTGGKAFDLNQFMVRSNGDPQLISFEGTLSDEGDSYILDQLPSAQHKAIRIRKCDAIAIVPTRRAQYFDRDLQLFKVTTQRNAPVTQISVAQSETLYLGRDAITSRASPPGQPSTNKTFIPSAVDKTPSAIGLQSAVAGNRDLPDPTDRLQNSDFSQLTSSGDIADWNFRCASHKRIVVPVSNTVSYFVKANDSPRTQREPSMFQNVNCDADAPFGGNYFFRFTINSTTPGSRFAEAVIWDMVSMQNVSSGPKQISNISSPWAGTSLTVYHPVNPQSILIRRLRFEIYWHDNLPGDLEICLVRASFYRTPPS